MATLNSRLATCGFRLLLAVAGLVVLFPLLARFSATGREERQRIGAMDRSRGDCSTLAHVLPCAHRANYSELAPPPSGLLSGMQAS